MNRKEAIERILRHNPKLNEYIKRLMAYEKGMSSNEYCNKVKLPISNAIVFLRLHGITLDRINSLTKTNFKKRKLLSQKWDKNLTISANAIKLGIGTVTASLLSREFSLPYVHHKKLNGFGIKRIKRMMKFKEKGLRDSEIARLIGISRERVRQILIQSSIEEQK